MTIAEIRAAVEAGRWFMSQHAAERAKMRYIEDESLARLIAEGEVIEDYPEDPRGPSALVLTWDEGRCPMHAVCAFDPDGSLVIITVYTPKPPKWLDERTRNPKGGQQ